MSIESVNNRFMKMAYGAEHLDEFLFQASEVLYKSVMENFAAEGRPTKWLPAGGKASRALGQQETWARGNRRFYRQWGLERNVSLNTTAKTLQRKGLLKEAIHTYQEADRAGVGIKLAYAAIHQFGGQAGRGHLTTIPARPYFVIQEEDRVKILDLAHTLIPRMI